MPIAARVTATAAKMASRIIDTRCMNAAAANASSSVETL
jgi:hypothetical protein